MCCGSRTQQRLHCLGSDIAKRAAAPLCVGAEPKGGFFMATLRLKNPRLCPYSTAILVCVTTGGFSKKGPAKFRHP